MCGRMVVTRTAHEIAQLFDLFGDPDECELGPRYNVAPSQNVMAIRMRTGEGRALSLLHWGLIPSWAKQRSVAYRMINARSETASEKPSFRKALRARRCIVPADGFYEWQQPAAAPGQGKAPKIPHYFRNPAGDVLAIAGLWESWTDRSSGEIVESCTLLTTEANDDVRPVHHRMPVFLEASDYELWLDPALHEVCELEPLLVPARPGLLEAIPVSTRVNNPRNEDPRCIEAAP
jgi:putative SOS response-associated peptidase YedK